MEKNKKKKIIIFSSNVISLLNFRKQLIEKLIYLNYKVIVFAPNDKKNQLIKLKKKGVKYYKIDLKNRSLNIFNDLLIFFKLFKLTKKEKPEKILAYTIKPIIISGFISKFFKLDFFPMFTGLGFRLDEKHIIKNIYAKIILFLCKLSLSKSKKMIFQNNETRNFFIKKNIIKKNKTNVVNGSGVDLKYFRYSLVSKKKFKNLRFLCLTRIQKVKGIYELIEASKIIKKKYPKTEIDIVGELEPSFGGIPKNVIDKWVIKKYINYHGYKDDIRPFLKKTDVLILASYHEGLPRSVLEAMSVGRPVIVTNIPGSKILVKSGENGFKIPIKDSVSLKNKMLWFIKNQNQINKMGKISRRMIEDKFDVKMINNQLLKLMEIK